LCASDGALTRVELEGHAELEAAGGVRRGGDPVLARGVTQLREYFAGARDSFDLPLAPNGTDFQRRAWAALREIPFGETRSYGEQARAIHRPTAVRAIGAANSRNPLGIIVPCHRVIGSDGKLTGYAGGLPAKQWLLDHEARIVRARSEPLLLRLTG
jgi:methylated-DNA-[protein]-cysteine S-methyltransferase